MNDLYNSKKIVWSLLAAFVIVWLYVLGVRTLVPPDEGRYAEMAREMFATGDWVTTRLNGIKYFEKPPLQTWMNAASFAVFGLGEWQARLWTGLCGLGGVLLTGYAGNRVFGARAGFYAALALGSSLFWVASGQIDSLDMSLSGMMTVVLCAVMVAQRDGAGAAERRNWMLVCWAGMALAVLAKGLIGLVLPGAVLVLYSALSGDLAIWKRLHLGKGLLLFFAVATPWFVLVALRNPEQPYFFFVHEHWERFFLKTHHREGAWYYFFVMLVPGIVPWLGLLPQALWGAVRRERNGVFQPKLLLLIWTVFIFFFFSYSSSKLPGYILPIFPALALLIAVDLENASRRSLMIAAGLLVLIGVAGVAAVPQMVTMAVRHPEETALLEAYQPWVLMAGIVAAAGGALALLHARHLRRDLTVLTMAIAGFVATQLILTGFEPYGKMRAGKAVALKMLPELKPDTKIYSVSTYEQSMTFYLQRTVVLVDYWDEFTFGLRQQPELSIPTVDAFVVQWNEHIKQGVKVLAILSPEKYEELKGDGLAMRVVAEDTRRVVVANL
ncbi:glycosyltransferase family 39 protein [Duganella violaceipulchra]|uniref:4-amino-4-deoxy-L-arabinose transferase-like glycosyltransferase n=1 Tax=Duganella violaceipulchra TaxID=2849652 RepID=A0AA41H650_9BURK|nr:glycosyltransferase family 39 protein [Duganella violaceicalia]MBV6321029.1 glycosyltransferase family 39 protein [Duganella violaceicalia]MCP2009725.1 4-amino-4-deoxy-L-arabinose transferase-like glycosyltransferase [Duganella violaceicalia]